MGPTGRENKTCQSSIDGYKLFTQLCKQTTSKNNDLNFEWHKETLYVGLGNLSHTCILEVHMSPVADPLS